MQVCVIVEAEIRFTGMLHNFAKLALAVITNLLHNTCYWKYINEECTRRDMLFGGDGHSCVMSTMKQSASLLSWKEPLLNDIPSSPSFPRIPSIWKELFQMHPRSTISYVQDIVHVGVKLKSRLHP